MAGASLSLTNVSLLACQFVSVGSPRPDGGRQLEFVEDDDWFVEQIEGAELRYQAKAEGGDFFLFVELNLIGPVSPYDLNIVVGATFAVTTADLEARRAAHTLLFMAFPYLREVVHSLTARSSYEGFWLPPLTKLPAPQISQALASDETPAPNHE